MFSCWEINVLIFLFIFGNVIFVIEDIICFSFLVLVVLKVVVLIGCCWGFLDFFVFEVCSLFLILGYWVIL